MLRNVWMVAAALAGTGALRAGAQGLGIGTGQPAPWGMLDTLRKQARLPLRTTAYGRELIRWPAQGQVVYQTNASRGLYRYEGTQWVNVPSGLVPDEYGYTGTTNRGEVRTLAGLGGFGYTDGPAEEAQFYGLSGLAVAPDGTVYVADTNNNCIRKITPQGEVNTLAGSGQRGYADGIGRAAQFYQPKGVAVDAAGRVYVADQGNSRIRRITPDGLVSTVAGPGSSAGDQGPGPTDHLRYPTAVAVAPDGTLYVADDGSNCIYQVSPDGQVSRLAGSGEYGAADGQGAAASFVKPTALALDAAGTLYVADQYNSSVVRKITPQGLVTTWVRAARSKWTDGQGIGLAISAPIGLALDTDGNVYLANQVDGGLIQKITPGGAVSTLAGAGPAGYADGPGPLARFDLPAGLGVDARGTVYVAEYANSRVRKITPQGVVSTLAGVGVQVPAGYADGRGVAVRLQGPTGVAVGRGGRVYVADCENHCIRIIAPGGQVRTLAGAGRAGLANGWGRRARFNRPAGVAVDEKGAVYVADSENHCIRKISRWGWVSTLAGSARAGAADGVGPGAQFSAPMGVAVARNGTVYVADSATNSIRKITPGGRVSTLRDSAHIGSPYRGHDLAVGFDRPQGVAVDADDTVYVADTGHHRICRIAPGGQVSTYSGQSGEPGYFYGDAMYAARYTRPTGVAVHPDGTVYVVDRGNYVRYITPGHEVRILTGELSRPGHGDGARWLGSFRRPTGVAVDAAGRVYVADTGNNSIRVVR